MVINNHIVNKEFIPYEQALALKELGFDEPCFAVYNKHTKSLFGTNVNDLNDQPRNLDFPEGMSITAPLYQQAFRWFIEKHNLLGQVNIHSYFIYDISDYFKTIKIYDKLEDKREEAELACLVALIEIVKQNS
jgi:hypothetical protein